MPLPSRGGGINTIASILLNLVKPGHMNQYSRNQAAHETQLH